MNTDDKNELTGERPPEEAADIDAAVSRVRSNREFFRGILFGLLLGGIACMAVLLVTRGTLRREKSTAGGVLTSDAFEKKLAQVGDIIDDSFLYEADPDMLEKYVFRGVAAGLDDPYAAYYDSEELDEINIRSEGTYRGIGIVFVMREDRYSAGVGTVYEDSPAMEGGVREGDILTAVNGEDVAGLLFSDAVDLIKKEAESVELTFLRGEETYDVTLALREIKVSQVEDRMLSDEVGYIRIAEFEAVTVEQFFDAVNKLKGEGARGLVFDVRGNPGGLLTSVCSILDELLDECLLVSTKNKNHVTGEFYAEDGRIFDGPMAVIVNESSASAAEVFSGVLQDYGAATIVGTATYGKGLVQTTWQLADGSAIKMTSEKYFTGGGQDLDGSGVQPDIVTDDEDRQLEEALGVVSEALS